MSATGHDNVTGNEAKSSNDPVNLATHFTRADKFNELFAYGMEMVEETASFLDSEGRNSAKKLSASAQAVYGTESMRLTTRLMQLASWLLLQRAVVEGEMSPEQASTEKKNVKLDQLHTQTGGKDWNELPEKFVELVESSVRLQRRIIRMDEDLYRAKQDTDKVMPPNPVAIQHDLLATAFDPRFGC